MTNEKPASPRDVAKAFGMVKPESSLDDLEAQEGAEVRGGATVTGAALAPDPSTDAHACMACPHPAGFVVTKTTLSR